MAHKEQRAFFERVKHLHPQSFKDVCALDCGSLDVNGCLRDLFEGGRYIGVDIVAGRNVDLVSPIHQLYMPRTEPEVQFDTIVSGEMLEHDQFWMLSLERMYELLKPGGLLAISCAGPGRPEHGTRRTGNIWGTHPDYYQNIGPSDVRAVFKFDVGGHFRAHELNNRTTFPQDTYFWGVKS